MITTLKENLLSISNDEADDIKMIREGNVCLGLGKYKNNIVSLWLKKNNDLELIRKEEIIKLQVMPRRPKRL